MKKCELCKSTARMYCESDRASLCWDCDARVHTANFLVAKHSRNLLCHACQSPTPWTGSGSQLGKTVSLCESCSKRSNRYNDGDHDLENGNIEEDEDEDEEEDEEEEEEDEHNEKEDGADNQVVPLSSKSLPPPLASSSSSSEESFTGLSRGRNGVFSSVFGISSAPTVEDSRFSYNGIERPQEKSTQKMGSWTWR